MGYTDLPSHNRCGALVLWRSFFELELAHEEEVLCQHLQVCWRGHVGRRVPIGIWSACEPRAAFHRLLDELFEDITREELEERRSFHDAMQVDVGGREGRLGSEGTGKGEATIEQVAGVQLQGPVWERQGYRWLYEVFVPYGYAYLGMHM